ncbi:hypothetical protein L873DRAFT_1716549 [Choiromyces venosus 120613-1]|uniref:Uncharacterized protein n=1 Tax=Choiromyces venosus 120613-1 TaxID=1336337 RepID=A0A3N4J0S6_9PEZI|nr:hypothetical protein L873DRAFT_1716549 [Choiromyces venosus 120613-1]
MASLRQGQVALEQRVVVLQQRVLALQQGQGGLQERGVALQQGQTELQGRVEALQQEPMELQEGQGELLQRVVAIQEGQTELQERVVALQQGQVEFQEGLVALQQGQAGFQEGQVDLLEQIKHLNQEFPRQDKNNIARLINRAVTRRTTSLEPFYGLNGQLVPGFPRTGADIGRLNSDAINALLVALGLEVTGAVAARKERFKRYIGLVTGTG